MVYTFRTIGGQEVARDALERDVNHGPEEIVHPHERMHKTLKQQTTRPPAATMRGQQRRFDHFRREFSEERPHEALERQDVACPRGALNDNRSVVPDAGPDVEKSSPRADCQLIEPAGKRYGIAFVEKPLGIEGDCDEIVEMNIQRSIGPPPANVGLAIQAENYTQNGVSQPRFGHA